VYISLTSGEPPPETQEHLRDAGGVPILRGAVEAFGAIASVARWEASRERRLAVGALRPGWPALALDRRPWGHEGPIATAAGSGPEPAVPEPAVPERALPERESLAVLAAAGIPVTQAIAARDAAAAVAAAASIGGPVALKLDAVGLAHKTDEGGVRLGLSGPTAIRSAAEELLAIGRGIGDGVTLRGLLVEPMAAPGLELLAGLQRDPQFGPVVVVGLGGVLTEILDDVVLRLAPLAHDDALAMLSELRASRLLDGVRGRPAVDREAVAAILVALGRIAADRPDVVAIDINPIIAGPSGAMTVDALVVERTAAGR
jgi:acyl-CoA synthetase (NDP forming)